MALYTCKRAIGKRWGLKPRVVHWLYTTLVKLIIMYGVVVWWKALEMTTYCAILSRVQRMASLCITGALSTAPSDALNVMLHLLPLDIVGRQVAAASAIRLRQLSQWSYNGYVIV